MSPATPNKIIFERENIKVSETRFETGVEVFQIKRISGVRMEFEKRQTRTGIPLLAGGIATLLAGALTHLPVLIVAGAAFTVAGTILCVAKANGAVIITIRGRDVRTISSKDANLLNEITAALKSAVERRL